MGKNLITAIFICIKSVFLNKVDYPNPMNQIQFSLGQHSLRFKLFLFFKIYFIFSSGYSFLLSTAYAQSPTLTSSINEPPQIAIEKKCVILLHGLARSKNSMGLLADYFKSKKFLVFNKSYPSTQQNIETLSAVVGDGIKDCEEANASKIYFVTHSMGGILVRQYFQSKTINAKIAAVVMISSPNHGSEIVDAFKNKSWFKWYNGPAGLQLGTAPSSLPNTLKPINIPIGIITGNVSSDPWFSYLFKGPNDGKVSVESAKLKEMKALLVVPWGHTFIMNSPEVHNQTFYFFENLKFQNF